MNTTPAIDVGGLRKTFGQVIALDRLSFQVPAGTVLGLLGPNGSGKTTAVSILSTVLRPDDGRARSAAWTWRPTRPGSAA